MQGFIEQNIGGHSLFTLTYSATSAIEFSINWVSTLAEKALLLVS